MTKNKKGGKKDSKNSAKNDAEASTVDNVTNQGNKSKTVSSGVTLKTAESSRNSQSSVNTSASMAEKSREKKDNVKSRRVTFEAMQSDAEACKNKDKITTGKDGDNLTSLSQEVAFSAEISKKKRRSRRGKSEPNTSGTESLANAEYEGCKLDCSNTFLDNVDVQNLIASRISAIESGATEPKSIKYMQKYKINRSPTMVKIQKATLNTRNVQYSSKDKLVLVSGTESKTRDSIKPVKKVMTISPGFTLERVSSAESRQASANRPQNMTKMGMKDNDNFKSTSVFHAEIQKNMHEDAKNGNENATGKSSDNLTSLRQEVAFSADISKKKRSRRGKSVPSTSGTESLARAEYEGCKLDCSDTFLDKGVYIRELMNARKITNIGDENVENSSKENQAKIPDNDSKTDYSIRRVIFLTDKSTQTDPLPDLPRSNSALKSDADRTVMAEATESDLNLPPEETNLENISKDIDMWKEFGSNLSLLHQNLQSFGEEFLRDLKITSDNFEVGIIKCLTSEK